MTGLLVSEGQLVKGQLEVREALPVLPSVFDPSKVSGFVLKSIQSPHCWYFHYPAFLVTGKPQEWPRNIMCAQLKWKSKQSHFL